ncbi:MAG: sugar transferase [Ruminococcaceae bacterium]|nr:sugar transferase [Oscillospiraceae bacterium]
MYAKYIKRPLDFFLSLCAITVFSPILLILIILGAVFMGGNPFFTQQRPGRNEKIFKLIKFRTMTNKKDNEGNLLPDEKRLTKYGKFLRSTSLDELPELINILKGDMAVIGPRPLLVQYLPLYNDHQKRRHEVRPGLSGLAQINGRNSITWEQKFDDDVKYVDNITFWGDIKIIFTTFLKVFKREGISQENNATMEFFTGSENKEEVTVAK